MAPLFHVVLHEPEIPNNTGNIGRTCVALGCALHLVHPLGFETDEKACRRAGLDYWPRLDVREHDSWGECEAALPARRWFFTTRTSRSYFDAEFRPGDAMIFGKETEGLPGALLAANAERLLRLPMLAGERSLNVATAVCAVLYEAVRQSILRGDLAVDGAGNLTAGRGGGSGGGGGGGGGGG